jgi:hypothetical protein
VRAQKLDAIDADMKKAKNLINLYELELRSIPPAERNAFKTKLKDHKKRQTDATTELTWVRTEDQKGDLTGERKADYAKDIRQLDSKQAMVYGEKLQNESLASLDRSLASIDDSTKVRQIFLLLLFRLTLATLSRLVSRICALGPSLRRAHLSPLSLHRVTASLFVYHVQYLLTHTLALTRIILHTHPTPNRPKLHPQVGSETAQALQAQTEQLGRIYDELYEIDDMLDRSTQIIKKMLKATATDKCVWIFAFLLLCAIIATVIVTKVGPKNALADKVKT